MKFGNLFLTLTTLFFSLLLSGQVTEDPSLLTLDRIYGSAEFRPDFSGPIKWIDGGNAFVRIETNGSREQELVKYELPDLERQVIIASKDLIPKGKSRPIHIEDITFSSDESLGLIFTNSSRVWRANTKGDFWLFDFSGKTLQQVGASFPPSSLMFAKLTPDNSSIAYVHDFNLYLQNRETGDITQVTSDGGEGIVNGTFDWAYEEEFGLRDGFQWNQTGKKIAFWNLDASDVGTFYMINYTDSIYSRPIPLQYPKVGQDPSTCKIGIYHTEDKAIEWIPLEPINGQHYIPGMQWVDEHTVLLQQLNRLQNTLYVWTYNTRTKTLKKIYSETEETWVDVRNLDVTRDWEIDLLPLVEENKAFLRLSETDGWRHLYKIDIQTGEKTLLTPGDYDVASMNKAVGDFAYVYASPQHNYRRTLYRVNLNGKKALEPLSPPDQAGINIYDISPNGKFARHSYSTVLTPNKVALISLPDHKVLQTLIDNRKFEEKIATLQLPTVEFSTITSEEGIEMDVRMIYPPNFDSNKQYPALFHMYGEPAGQTVIDRWIGMWNIYLAQQGYVVIDVDNRGVPTLKGRDWRKSIYRKIGILNAQDQAAAAKELLKLPYLDENRTATWGWSGGGNTTLNLMFKYPGIFKTGVAIASVTNQLLYDNIYQERFMGLPQQNIEDYIEGSPVAHAKNLEGNLLIIHGTNDDNVHYQNMELLVNELIKYDKQFQMMIYPNRSHGIYEGANTRKHLFTLIANYLSEHLK